MVIRSVSGVAALALVAVGGWSVRDRMADVIAEAIVIIKTPPAAPKAASVQVPRVSSTMISAAPAALADTTETDSLQMAFADGELDVSDSIHWEPAVARTWVNVRNDASREGDVVGVIKPSDKAMLGMGRFGWRQVKSPDVTGWVDPRLFEADSLRTRG